MHGKKLELILHDFINVIHQATESEEDGSERDLMT